MNLTISVAAQFLLLAVTVECDVTGCCDTGRLAVELQDGFVVRADPEALTELEERGMVEHVEGGVRATDSGRYWADRIMSRLAGAKGRHKFRLTRSAANKGATP